MLKGMNSKSTQNAWCYRYKLLSLWISSIGILGFLLHSCILKMCFKNTLVQGWGWGQSQSVFFSTGVGGGFKMSIWGRTYLMDGPLYESILHSDYAIALRISRMFLMTFWLMIPSFVSIKEVDFRLFSWSLHVKIYVNSLKVTAFNDATK